MQNRNLENHITGGNKMKKLFIVASLVLSLAFAGIASAAVPFQDRGTVTAKSYVNIRSLDSTKGKILDHMNKGETLPYIGGNPSWTAVLYDGQQRYVSTRYLTIQPAPSHAEQVIDFGKQFMGAPYGFSQRVIENDQFVKGDCSAFVQFVYGHYGISLPWSSRLQSKIGTPVAKGDLRPGDLIFTDTNRDGVINHVSIYMGNDQLLHTYKVGVGVTISKFSGSVWDKTFVNARRVL
jgi:cell wall-associated NlpC family hydrolase